MQEKILQKYAFRGTQYNSCPMNPSNPCRGRLPKSDQITNGCSEPNDLLTSRFGLYKEIIL